MISPIFVLNQGVTVPPIFPVTFGLLYNHPSIYDSRQLSASGWRLATYTEATNFVTFLTASTGGGKLKEIGLTYWNSPNLGANNMYGFNARGAGQRISTGLYNNFMGSACIWVQNYSPAFQRYRFVMAANSAAIDVYNINEKYASSVRFVNESTTLTNGQTGTYTGNDGKLYRTICINGIEWLADNLAETKFRNGDIIPFAGANGTDFSDLEWQSLTGSALCPPNGDWNNV